MYPPNPRTNNARCIGDLLVEFMHESGLDKTYYERDLIRRWPEVVSPMAAQLTKRLEIKDGVLYAYIHSAALKAQLFSLRFELVEQLNQAVGAKVIHDIRLLG